MHTPRISRRNLIATAVVGGAAALLAQPTALLDQALAGNDPGCDPHAAIDPFGLHQAGIVTPAPQHLQLAAFDLAPDSTRDDLIALLQTWQGAIVLLAKGQPLPDAGEPDKAPADTGEALSQRADRLTVTIGFGASLFDARFGLAAQRPAALVDLPAFTGDALNPARSHGDLSVQCCAETRLVAEHALRTLARLATGRATLRWTQAGFNEPPANPADGSGRNLFGFKDGTANLDAGDPARMSTNVWAAEADGTPWMANGTYQVYRRVQMLLRMWDEETLKDQEDSIGRRRLTGAPFGGTGEFDRVVSANLPLDSHVRLSNPRTGADSEAERILRRGYSYHDGVDATTGEYDAGLAFIAYQRDPRRQFISMQTRLAASDALNEYIVHTASGIFAIPSGAQPGGFVGDVLFGFAQPRPSTPTPIGSAPAPAPVPGEPVPTPVPQPPAAGTPAGAPRQQPGRANPGKPQRTAVKVKGKRTAKPKRKR